MQQDCLVVVRTRLPSEERDFPFHCLSALYAVCRFCLDHIYSLPHSLGKFQFMVCFLKLIIWGAGMSNLLGEEIKGLQLTLCPEGERSGAVSIRLVPSVLFWAPVWSGSIPHSFPCMIEVY